MESLAGAVSFNHRMLVFDRSTAFTVVNLTVDGNRTNRVPAERLGGHNIHIRGGSAWTFCNVRSDNSTTDGIYITQHRTGSANAAIRDVLIRGVRFENNSPTRGVTAA